MKVIRFDLKLEGSDLVENWILDRRVSLASDELHKAMEDYFVQKLRPRKDDNPLIAALIVAAESVPHEYAFFGEMVEVRYNDAFKQISVE